MTRVHHEDRRLLGRTNRMCLDLPERRSHITEIYAPLIYIAALSPGLEEIIHLVNAKTVIRIFPLQWSIAQVTYFYYRSKYRPTVSAR